MRTRLTRLVVSIVAGLLLYASFPPRNCWWAAVVALALLAWVLTHRATTPVGGLGYGLLFGLVFYVSLLPWIGELVGPGPWLALATTCALFPGIFGLFAVVVRLLPGWPIWFAVGWAAQEWLKSILPFGGFPWGSVAFGQAEGPLLPLVQLGGVALLSTGVALVGCGLTAIALEIEKWWRTGGQGDAPPAVVLPAACICLVLFAAIVVWPQVRHAGSGSGGEPTVTVAVVQGNVPRLGLDFNAQRRAVLDNHVEETLRLAADVHAGLAQQPQFVIWPENSSDIDPFVNPDAGQRISAAAEAIGAPILIGTLMDVPGRPRENPEWTNTAIVWNPGTGPADRHDKAIVQPFGEYLPMPWLFRHLSGYADRAGHFVPGNGTGVVRIAGVPVGVATCWEVIFDRAPRKSILGGAQLLTVPSNNATFNKTMSEQQLAFAKVRAVEHDRYVVVAGTTGISAVIAPDGGELIRTDFFQPAYLDSQVRLKTRLTPATRWGPILQWILVGAAAAVVLVAMRQNGWFPRPRRSEPKGENDDSDAPPGRSEASGPPALSESDDELIQPEQGGRHSSGFGRHRATSRSYMTTGQPAPPAPGNRPSQRVLVIIPTFNERENLPVIHRRLTQACPAVHVLVVDDSSPDGTGQLADELAQADPGRTHVMHRTAKNGLGAAYLAGFAWGLSREYSVLVEMDADGSHAPEQLQRLLDAVDAGADLAIGSRYVAGGTVRNWPWRRLVLSKTANTYSRLALGIGIHDITAGYRAYRREALEAIDLDGVDSKGYCFQIDLTWRTVSNGFVVTEVPITFTERELGVSKMSGSNIREALVKVARWGIEGRLSRSDHARARPDIARPGAGGSRVSRADVTE
ncbi:polyprenol-monophosphomannose synthase ppm1 [Mycobacterium tuberculosis]|nr:apolipoprotein N-acyltransferase [Mycobacterium tuberculosis variant bovis]CFS60622.1 polyprenol-monophosphomannose synthase ppm1 [Mycobacterium tuberculosis]CKN15314.1 polyprenol-monophosphomannose synthase ppm1 [Mycobacterium tuberculosis]CKN72218.1 polyprenol-monophosphomannose synthase ppm1 [Mycobacterium tuberculosis]CKP86162.1 polyprenol-monophosphomannose synthase ppm1 [Mycobacterium tuberculosis]